MVNPAPTASLADEKEYPQTNGRRRKTNDHKDPSNSSLVVEEPII
jgi:hypothetical protein